MQKTPITSRVSTSKAAKNVSRESPVSPTKAVRTVQTPPRTSSPLRRSPTSKRRSPLRTPETQTMNELTLLNEFSVEMVKGRSVVDKCCICDRNFISEEYERMALDIVSVKNFYGIFIYKGSVLAAYVVFHIVNNTCEVQLLCSNKQLRIGAATKLMRYLLYKAKEYKLDAVTLKIASEHRNARAVAFYSSLGFVHMKGDKGTYQYVYKRQR